MKLQQFHAIAFAFLATKKALELAKEEVFPRHCVVSVICSQYTGYGIVVTEDGCPVEKISVQLENDNVWRYNLTDCVPVRRQEWPEWVKCRIRRFRTIETRHRRSMTDRPIAR